MTTSDDIVDPSPGTPSQSSERTRRHSRRFWWIVGPLIGFLVVGLVTAIVMPLPYYAVRPGSARTTEPLIAVDGVETYPSDGEVLFTTVSLKQVTAFRAFAGWLDDDVRVLSEEELFGPRTASQNRQFNQQLMDSSKLTGTKVALEQLGYSVPVTITGELVVDVEPASPADGVLAVGDTVVAFNGERLDTADELTGLLRGTRPGDTVVLTVEAPDRSGERDEQLTLAERPDGGEHGYIGVGLQPRDLDFDFPFEIAIDSGDVGGPSAGLAFTLAVLDLLTPGELTGGVRVAVTGTMAADGTVGDVGGVAQKAAAVRQAGIDYFLVPPGEFDDAVAHAGSNLEVIAVGTLSEALAALDGLGGNALALGTPGATEEAAS